MKYKKNKYLIFICIIKDELKKFLYFPYNCENKKNEMEKEQILIDIIFQKELS